MIYRFLAITSAFVILFFTSCSEYNQVLKSTDYEYKFKKAIEYYETGEFARSTTIFEELVYVYRGTSKGDDVYYYYGSSLYNQQIYPLAGHYFKSLTREYPQSEYAENSYFMIAMSYFKQSPKVRLEQSTSKKAIESFSLFINLYPYSKRLDDAEKHIAEMNDKLAYKSYLTARLYYDMSNYKSAVIALNNSLLDYPATMHREDIRFLLLESKYYVGTLSIEEKKVTRLNDAIDEYWTFIDEFPESKYLKDAKSYYRDCKKELGQDVDNI